MQGPKVSSMPTAWKSFSEGLARCHSKFVFCTLHFTAGLVLEIPRDFGYLPLVPATPLWGYLFIDRFASLAPTPLGGCLFIESCLFIYRATWSVLHPKVAEQLTRS